MSQTISDNQTATPDLTSPQGRQRAFTTKLDQYMRSIHNGGYGHKNIDEALNAMRSHPEDSKILKAMD